MSTKILRSKPAPECTGRESCAHETVSISADRLIVGRQLKYAIYDHQGLLLLAEGSLVTARFQDLLAARQIREVRIHPDDMSGVRPSREVRRSSVAPLRPAVFETELTKKLDSVIDSSTPTVANTGPAVRNRMVVFGRTGYDPRRGQRLHEQHVASTNTLGTLMQSAVTGSEVSGPTVAAVAAGYLAELATDTDHVLSVAAEVRQDMVLSNHCLQLAILGMAIGIEMGLDDANVRTIGLCGMMHDWGMIKVPEELRNANRVLSEAEFAEIKKHSIYSVELLQSVLRIPSVVVLVSYQVHEKFNGQGYPRGTRGNAIHPFARILHVADSYLALTSHRPYRPAMMSYTAMECLLKQAREQVIDPNVVRSLLHILSLFPIGSYLAFTDGSVGRVLRRNGNQYTSPIVQIVRDRKGRELPADDPFTIINLADSLLKVQHALPAPGQTQIALNESVLHRKRG